jgi:nitrate reductase NapAB chaperone NapD
MTICSYLAIPAPGEGATLRARLAALPGCEVVPAENRELLVLVTETPDRGADDALRARIEGMAGLQALVLTFAEVEV